MDAEAFTTLYESHYSRVYNYISYRINNHHNTEDLVSAVFEKVMTRYDSYSVGASPLEAWIITIARNVVMDYFRRCKRGKNWFSPWDAAADMVSPGRQPDELCVVHEANRGLMQALQALSEKERSIIAMKYAAGLKNREIAQVLGKGMTENNVGVVTHRALRKMRQYLQEEDAGYELRVREEAANRF